MSFAAEKLQKINTWSVFGSDRPLGSLVIGGRRNLIFGKGMDWINVAVGSGGLL